VALACLTHCNPIVTPFQSPSKPVQTLQCPNTCQNGPYPPLGFKFYPTLSTLFKNSKKKNLTYKTADIEYLKKI